MRRTDRVSGVKIASSGHVLLYTQIRKPMFSKMERKVDMSQVFALASIWIIFLIFGSLVVVGPTIYTIILGYQDAFGSGISHGSQASMAVGSLIGYPIAPASVKVFAFLKSDESNNSPHRADCHVCESLLEFRTKVEESDSRLGRQWVHGRIYLVLRRRQRWKKDLF